MRNFGTKADNTAPAAGGVLTAAEDNVRFNELKNAVTSAGIALDNATGPDTNVNMLAEAIARYASGAVMCVDNGAANTYVLAITGGFIAPKAYFKGMRVKFYARFANTGPSTINAFGLGARKFLTHATAAMSGGEVLATREIEADFDPTLDGGAGAFRICPWANAVLFPSGTPTSTQVTTGEGITVNTSSPYKVDLNYPSLTAGSPAADDLVAFFKSSVGSGQTHHQTSTYAAFLAAVSAGVSVGQVKKRWVNQDSSTYSTTARWNQLAVAPPTLPADSYYGDGPTYTFTPVAAGDYIDIRCVGTRGSTSGGESDGQAHYIKAMVSWDGGATWTQVGNTSFFWRWFGGTQYQDYTPYAIEGQVVVPSGAPAMQLKLRHLADASTTGTSPIGTIQPGSIVAITEYNV